MPNVSETASSLWGLNRILRLDPRGIDAFKTSVEGFWNSFAVAYVTLPFFLVQAALFFMATEHEIHLLRFLAMETVGFALGWLVMPTVMLSVSQMLGCFDRYFHYIVPYNWFQLVVAAVLLPLSVVQAIGILPQGLVALLFLLSTSAFLMYGWFIARHGLGVGGGTAGWHRHSGPFAEPAGQRRHQRPAVSAPLVVSRYDWPMPHPPLGCARRQSGKMPSASSPYRRQTDRVPGAPSRLHRP